MHAIRIIGGVVAGYFIFAIASMSLLGLLGARTGFAVMAGTLLALAVIGVVAGLAVRLIAATAGRPVGAYVLAGLVALATLANLILQLGAEPTWYKLGTLLLTVPAVVWAALRGSAKAASK